MMSLHDYLFRDVDLPFTGQFGGTNFITDLIFSPAELCIEDTESGGITGFKEGKIHVEIPGSYISFLAKNLYLLPTGKRLKRTIRGTDSGEYKFVTLHPNKTSLMIYNTSVTPHTVDTISIEFDRKVSFNTNDGNKRYSIAFAKEEEDHIKLFLSIIWG